MKVVQVSLKRGDNYLTTYVDYRPNLKEGIRITLRDNKNLWWTVETIYLGSITEADKLHTDWDIDI